MRVGGWRLMVLVLIVYAAGCRAPFPRHEDRKYEAPPRNAPGSNEVLYQRLGGENGIVVIVDAWVARAGIDPAVNFSRAGTSREWRPTAEEPALLKKHLAQYLSGATGGPTQYAGKDVLDLPEGIGVT